MKIQDNTVRSTERLVTLASGDCFFSSGQLFLRLAKDLGSESKPWMVPCINLQDYTKHRLDEDTLVRPVEATLTVAEMPETIEITDFKRDAKITAIKAVRTLRGLGLKGAKRVVDDLQTYGYPFYVSAKLYHKGGYASVLYTS